MGMKTTVHRKVSTLRVFLPKLLVGAAQLILAVGVVALLWLLAIGWFAKDATAATPNIVVYFPDGQEMKTRLEPHKLYVVAVLDTTMRIVPLVDSEPVVNKAGTLMKLKRGLVWDSFEKIP